MTQLPKPQEQLQNYFNSLLIDENGEPVLRQARSLVDRSTDADGIDEKVSKGEALVSEPAREKSPDSVKGKEFDEADLLAYELQQQKLQKLLHNLSPTVAPAVETDSVSPELLIENLAQESLTETVTDYPDAVGQIATEQELLDIAGATHFAPPAPLFTSQWADNGRPAWAQEPFDILLLEVQDIKVAVPLATLGQIHWLDESLTPLFGQAEWFIGIQKTTMGNLKTIDIAQFIMPERYNTQAEQHHKYVVAIDGVGWGFAVDEIDQPIHIDPDGIRWRANRSNRTWMAGTVKEHMCVLLDIPALGETLVGKNEKDTDSEP